jgi:hypothetical protein
MINISNGSANILDLKLNRKEKNVEYLIERVSLLKNYDLVDKNRIVISR